MRWAEWLDSGPAELYLFLEWQSQRDNLHKLCAGTIAAANPWLKNVTAATFFPELIPPKTDEDIKEERREAFERQKQAITRKQTIDAKRKRNLENKRVKGA